MTDQDQVLVLGMVRAILRENAPIVITRGTDTMVQTGLYLQRALPELRVPIVLTGAMTPLGFEGSDGVQIGLEREGTRRAFGISVGDSLLISGATPCSLADHCISLFLRSDCCSWPTARLFDVPKPPFLRERMPSLELSLKRSRPDLPRTRLG